MKKTAVGYLAVATLAVTGLAIAEARLTVNEIMVSIVTPATNTLWGADDPQSDAEWQTLEEAAIAVIAATSLITEGAAGPSDKEWAAEAGCQGYAATMMKAAEDARAAAKAQDFDALLQAMDEIYPPCEECHQDFHPGFQ